MTSDAVTLKLESTPHGIALLRGDPEGARFSDTLTMGSERRRCRYTSVQELQQVRLDSPEADFWLMYPEVAPCDALREELSALPVKRLTVRTNAQLHAASWCWHTINWLELRPSDNNLAKMSKAWKSLETLVISPVMRGDSHHVTGELLARLPSMPRLSALVMENFNVGTLELLPEAKQLVSIECIGAATQMHSEGVRFLSRLPRLARLRLDCCSWGGHPDLSIHLPPHIEFEDNDPLW